MRTDVNQRTAALLVFIQEYAPGRNGSAAQRGCLCVIDLTKRAVLSLFLEVLSTHRLAALVTDGQLLARASSSVQHLLCFLGVDRHRLFAHNVLACFQRVHGDKGVGAVGRADVYDVNGLVLQELLVIRVNNRVGCAVLCLCVDRSLLNDVTECNQFNSRQLFERGHVLAVCNTAATDDTNSEFFHIFSPPFERFFA